MKIALTSDNKTLDEVIVTGYGNFKKSSFTGAAASMSTAKLSDVPSLSVEDKLSGNIPGVSISSFSGQPGAMNYIRIRGMGSINAGNDPLIVIDGTPMNSGNLSGFNDAESGNGYNGSGTNALSTLNSNDIESITVIKDAAAASLYGSRAANGVVVVTTKKGKSGKPTLNFRGAWGTSDNAVKNPVKADPYQQLTNTWQAIYNDKYYLEGLDPKAAGDYASQTVLGHMVNPRVNSKGETVYVTPFKWTGDASNYVLHLLF